MTEHKYPRFSAREKNKNFMRLLISDPQFQKEVVVIRKMPSPYSKGVKDEDVMSFVKAVSNLCDSFNIPMNCHSNIQEYILTGEVSFPLNNFAVSPSWPDFKSVNSKTYTRLSQKEQVAFLKEIKRFGNNLPTISIIRNLEEMFESEKLYKECEEYNKSEDSEYNLTIKELLLARNKTKVKKVYEDKRMLDDHRKKQFGKI